MRLFHAAFAAAALFAATATFARTSDGIPEVDQVVAAEWAFAAETAQVGINRGFTHWSTSDAVVLMAGQARTARDAFPDGPRSADEPGLSWWPNWAGIAMSGDLGFTTGGVSTNGARTGHYFTIWKKQADGQWRWIYDGGSGASSDDVPDAATEPLVLTTASLGSASPEAAMAEVKAAEATLAAAARLDQATAHLAVLADDGRLYVTPRPPALGHAAFAEALAAWPATFDFGPAEGGGSSDAGDLVWTYGPAAWEGEGQARHGHYVRLWQKRPAGWALVFAQLIPAPVRPATPAPPPAGG